MGKQRISLRSLERLLVPNRPDKCRLIDLMRQRSCNQRHFRTFSVIDGFNREALSIDIAIS
jgi:putative transposase